MSVASLLYLSAFLFAVGCIGFLVRRNAIVMFMSIEIMLNAVNLSLITFSAKLQNPDGMILAFFVLILAAAEAVIGLSIILMMQRNRKTIETDQFNILKSAND